jgi:Peptidase family M23
MRFSGLIAALFLPAAPVAAGDPVLGLPINCTLGETCYIQNQVDRDPGPGFRDYTCGALGYDGHKGTDIRVPTMADMRRGVDVLASAPGIVLGFRDGVADVGITPETAGKECGNGVVIRHDDGWETQYCHMKSGSITVQEDQQVARGDVLGQVGYSGQTQFPHVHISVRKDGQEVDPFDISAFPSCGKAGKSLWADTPTYTPGGLLDAGFSPGIPAYDIVKDGRAATTELARDAPALVLFGFGFSGQKGDVIDLRITGPDGEFLRQSIELDKDKAQFFRATGKRLKMARWPAGTYTGTVTLRRGAKTLGTRQVQTVIR